MRTLALALAVAVGAFSVADYLGWRAAQRRLAQLAAEADPDRRLPHLAAGLARETVPARATARLAWRLLRAGFDRQWLSELPAAERTAESRRDLDRLRLARQLAEESLRRQPASWRAAAVIGASRYLEASRLGRRDQPNALWREPLAAAVQLAPGRFEPPALLASFYLSSWSSLSADERQDLPSVLALAFADPGNLTRLLPAWVRLAPSLGTLLEPIPDRPDAWLQLGREFLRLGDLERFGISHRLRIESLAADLADRVTRGSARLRGGHPRAGLALLRSVLSAPPDALYADSFSAALAALPASATAGKTRAELARWLEWARDLCAVGRCPLDEATMARLLAATGEPEGPPPVELELPARGSWSGDEWQRRGDAYQLPLRVARPIERLRLEIPGVPPAGAAIELRWDGSFLGVFPLGPGEALRQPLAAAAGPHLLQMRHLSGRPLAPGKLILEPAGAAG